MEETSKPKITKEEFLAISSNAELKNLIKEKDVHHRWLQKRLHYESELRNLQVELIKLQQWVIKNKKRIAILFEGRDAAGKGGTIRRFSEHMNPRAYRTVALNKPTEVERGQWYFERYVRELPNPGEIVLFDRSWYNRAVVEPVMGFCTDEQYKKYMLQVTDFEHMLYEDDIQIIKFWFSISKDVQLERFNDREDNPLKRWKFSHVDKKGQEYWDRYTHFKEEMFSRTHTTYCPWIIVQANDKKTARLESIRYVLSQFDYDGKETAETTVFPDPNTVMRYYRSLSQLD